MMFAPPIPQQPPPLALLHMVSRAVVGKAM
jgi:hypothetical protein